MFFVINLLAFYEISRELLCQTYDLNFNIFQFKSNSYDY